MHTFRTIRSALVVLAIVPWVVVGQCPGPNGDSLCRSVGGSSSNCVPGNWVCLGTATACGCDFGAPASSAPPTSTARAPATTATPSTTRATTMLRTSAASTAPPTASPTEATIPTIPATQPPVAATCGSLGSQSLFVWAEWPELSGPSDWTSYYRKLLAFVHGNCGNFAVGKLVVRVTNPTITGLWTVSTSSVFYTELLSKLPSNVQLSVYPYLLDAGARAAWSSTGTPLKVCSHCH